jgi:hypothetical protein
MIKVPSKLKKIYNNNNSPPLSNFFFHLGKVICRVSSQGSLSLRQALMIHVGPAWPKDRRHKLTDSDAVKVAVECRFHPFLFCNLTLFYTYSINCLYPFFVLLLIFFSFLITVFIDFCSFFFFFFFFSNFDK